MIKFCAECGKPINEHRTWFWRRCKEGYEFYCYKCGRSMIGGPGDSRLATEYAWDYAREKREDEQQAKGSEG